MSKFSDTKYINTIDNLVSATKDKINNPYYKFSDKKPTKVTYYTQNVEKSTLDEASGLYEAHLGSKSPFKFNKIKDLVLYGIDRINVEYDVGEFAADAVVFERRLEEHPLEAFAALVPIGPLAQAAVV